MSRIYADRYIFKSHAVGDDDVVPAYATNYNAPVDGKIKGSAIYRKMSVGVI